MWSLICSQHYKLLLYCRHTLEIKKIGPWSSLNDFHKALFTVIITVCKMMFSFIVILRAINTSTQWMTVWDYFGTKTKTIPQSAWKCIFTRLNSVLSVLQARLDTCLSKQTRKNVQAKSKDITVIDKVIDGVINKKYNMVSPGLRMPRYIQNISIIFRVMHRYS